VTDTSEFSAALTTARIASHADIQTKVGRPLTGYEKVIHDAAFLSGVAFGQRDAHRSFDRILKEGH
jgi:hypothetical protein